MKFRYLPKARSIYGTVKTEEAVGLVRGYDVTEIPAGETRPSHWIET